MDETILLPSPNWFQVSGLVASNDGWLIYGGPSKSLCVLEPLPAEYNSVVQGPGNYHAHVFNRAHYEKIVSVAISLEWPEKRSVLTGSADGSVKQWNLDCLQHQKLKPTHGHEIHSNEKEEVAGVGYSTEVIAITVGCYGNIVKWDLNSNVVKTYSQLKSFKPVCMACSPHLPLHVAIGTKQGVVFVLDLNGLGKIIYKMRGQDDEIINLSWCPQYEVTVKKTLSESQKRAIIKEEETNKKTDIDEKEILEASGVEKSLPDDSFDDTVVPEDDMFDIYKDHEADEFGHKKYEPEDIYVKVQEDTKQNDYLEDCLKLKEEILKRKSKAESSIQSLVESLDSTHIDKEAGESSNSTHMEKEAGESSGQFESQGYDDTQTEKSKIESKHAVLMAASSHIHKHLLATISKLGGVRIWSKSGKLVGSCLVPNGGIKNQKGRMPYWPTLLWYKSDKLLLADGKNQLLECNPLNVDCKNKLDWSVVHSLHKRSIYCITSNAPHVQTGNEPSDNWFIWTTAQDRNIVQYSMDRKESIAVHNTCGGFIYSVMSCPYDAGKLAVSVGDGAVRVWETSTLEEDDTKLHVGTVTSYWQNVQGKVLVVAWHPTKENLLAFATAESRVGLINTSGRSEKPAKVLISRLSGGIYAICWGEKDDLYACGGGDLVVYSAKKTDEAPVPVKVEVDGERWAVSAAQWSRRGLACGGERGGVCVLAPAAPHALLTATYVYSKMIHTIQWHPQQTSNSSEESPYKNLMAVCSVDKQHSVVILKYSDGEDGGKQLQVWKTLTGHMQPVLQVMWNPHQDGVLLSTSKDNTVRTWQVSDGTCMCIFDGHSSYTLGATWSANPALGNKIISGGADACLRLWDVRDHPAEAYTIEKHDTTVKKTKKSREKKEKKEQNESKDAKNEQDPKNENESPNQSAVTEELLAANRETVMKGSRKFILPMLHRQTTNACKVEGAKILLMKYLEKTSNNTVEISVSTDGVYDLDYVKLFGTINELNELLDMEMNEHKKRNCFENWMMLAIFRGHIDAMIQFASQQDLLCPFLISIAPCVSFKYWKDASQLYLAQVERLVAKNEVSKLYESKYYGGYVYRKVATLLALHDVRAAVDTLTEANLYKEAYVLCRTRYMESIAEETLEKWATYCVRNGTPIIASVCYIVLGKLSKAATCLGAMEDEECLKLAADLAKASGQKLYADHISEKRDNIISRTTDKTEEILRGLPSRIELLMKENSVHNGATTHDGSGDTGGEENKEITHNGSGATGGEENKV